MPKNINNHNMKPSLYTCANCGNEMEVFEEDFRLINIDKIKLTVRCGYCDNIEHYTFKREKE